MRTACELAHQEWLHILSTDWVRQVVGSAHWQLQVDLLNNI